MVKVSKAQLWLFVLLWAIVAVGPGVGAQGDFMTLSLGDTEQIVHEKLAALERAKQIKVNSPTTFSSRFLDERVECSIQFFQGKLYQVLILFRGFDAASYDRWLRAVMEERINPALTRTNGTPSMVYDYPAIDDVDGILRLTAEWDFHGKTVLSGVMSDGEGYHAKVEIYDNRLVTAP